MSIFSLKRVIGFAILVLGMGLALMPFRSAFADDWNDPAVQYGYKVTRNDPVTFNSANGNRRLELKNRAEIERASAPTVHKDTTVNADYMCNWAYDKVLGRWVCEKDYMKAYQYTHPKPVPVCPFGYKLNYGGSDCVRILTPQYAHLNSRGDGWECNPGYHVNLTGSVCLSSKYVYQQCPGGSFSCKGGCQNTPCSNCNGAPVQQAILTAQPIVVNQIVNVNISDSGRDVSISDSKDRNWNDGNGEGSDSDDTNVPDTDRLPSTGPSILISLIGLSGLVARRLLKKD